MPGKGRDIVNQDAGKLRKLSDYSKNIHSQFGEDGIIEKIFSIAEPSSRVCVEFGAWDGFYLSNTANLWTNGWKGILIEADEKKFVSLKTNVGKYDCRCINQFVNYEGSNTLENILVREGITEPIDFLSVDVDGDDYYIFQSLEKIKPRVIACEYNPTIPIHMDLKSDKGGNFGCSALTLVQLAERKGYRLISMTDTNCFFIISSEYGKFNDFDTSLESIAPTRHLVYFMAGYGGEYLLSQRPVYGCTHPVAYKMVGEHYPFPEVDDKTFRELIVQIFRHIKRTKAAPPQRETETKKNDGG
jgi:hypothetical protein